MNQSIIQAVADTLAAEWPDRKIRVNEVPRDAAGNFFVNLKRPAYSRGLGAIRVQAATVTVVYVAAENDSLHYYGWLDTMARLFEMLPVAGRLTCPEDCHGEQIGRDWHFVFDVTLRGRVADAPADIMETLDQKARIKE